MAHSYSYLWKVPITIARFFTVYGPWGRPDMALFNFTKKIIEKYDCTVYVSTVLMLLTLSICKCG